MTTTEEQQPASHGGTRYHTAFADITHASEPTAISMWAPNFPMVTPPRRHSRSRVRVQNIASATRVNFKFDVSATTWGTRKYMNVRLLEEMDKDTIYSVARRTTGATAERIGERSFTLPTRVPGASYR